MPIYEYECLKCKEVFEIIQKKDDPPPKKHECGSRRVRKIMSQGSFILKGSGWYITDYARKGQKGGEGESSGSSTTEKKSAEKSKSDKSESSSGSKSKSKGKTPKASAA